MNKLLRDQRGSVLVEATIAFPLLLLITLGTIDVTYMLFEWHLASKAAYRGARIAIVSNPVATGITNLTWNASLMGEPCSDSTTGVPDGNCPTVTTVCTPTSLDAGTCSDGSTFNANAFKAIFNPASTDLSYPGMQQMFSRLQPQNVQISYQTTGQGFVGRPNGLPMSVTVSIRCMTHRFFFIGALMGWLFPSLPAECPPADAGPTIPTFASTLPSEAMGTTGG